MRWLVIAVVWSCAVPAYADDVVTPDAGIPAPPPPDAAPQPSDAAPIVVGKKVSGFKVRGDSKVHDRMIGRLVHLEIGDPVTPDQIPQLEAALLTSELFEKVSVSLEDTPDGGVLLVATLQDKLSWIAAPTIYILPSSYSFGVGFAENNLLGEDKKLLLYAQYGNRSSLLFGTYLDPAVDGSRLQLRFDIYAYDKHLLEYANPADNARSTDVARETTTTFLDAGVLVGWRFAWWLVGDFRFRGAYTYFRDAHDAAGAPLANPEKDGWDVSTQARLTADYRHHRFGVTWGPYGQVVVDASTPGLDQYDYIYSTARAYYSWRFFEEHELELRASGGIGRHLPFHEELTLGSASDLRGYSVEQFRGDRRGMVRAEYSVPLAKWKSFAFRAIGFGDLGFIGFYNEDPSGKRDYLPGQAPGSHWLRSDVGAGFRVYVSSIVLPLLGFDIAYGLESHSPEYYFEIGLTDF